MRKKNKDPDPDPVSVKTTEIHASVKLKAQIGDFEGIEVDYGMSWCLLPDNDRDMELTHTALMEETSDRAFNLLCVNMKDVKPITIGKSTAGQLAKSAKQDS